MQNYIYKVEDLLIGFPIILLLTLLAHLQVSWGTNKSCKKTRYIFQKLYMAAKFKKENPNNLILIPNVPYWVSMCPVLNVLDVWQFTPTKVQTILAIQECGKFCRLWMHVITLG